MHSEGSITTGGRGGARGYETLRQEWLSRAVSANVPISSTFELTHRCNLRCYHCYVDDRPVGELDTSRWIGIVDELADLGGALVSLTGGELALREGWRDIAAAIRSRNMMLGLLTNGTLLTDDDVEAIAKLKPVRVSLSVYGTDAETHDRVTGHPGSFDRTLRVIAELRQRNVPCRLSTVLMAGVGPKTVAAIEQLAEANGCDFGAGPVVYPSEEGSLDLTRLRVGTDELTEFYRLGMPTFLEAQRQLVEDAPEVPPRHMGNCRAGITGMFVEASGDVYPCMGWPPSLGNLANTPLREVWYSDIAEEHRRRMGQRLDACDKCELSGYCLLRCPKLAEMEDGDLCGTSSVACESAVVLAELRRERVATDERTESSDRGTLMTRSV